MTDILTVPNNARVFKTATGDTAIRLSKGALEPFLASLTPDERQRLAELNPDLRDMIAKSATAAAPTIEQLAEAARERVVKARAAREAHEKQIAPFWGCAPEHVAYKLSKSGTPDKAHQAYVAEETEAVTALCMLPQTVGEQVAKSYDGLIDASRAVMDTMAEQHVLAHAVPSADAHAFLAKNSSTYQQSANLWSSAITEKSNAVAAAEMRARTAVDGPSFDTAVASSKQVTKPYQTSGEDAVMARAGELAKHRGVTPERALADGLASGAHGDETLKSLYGQASNERWKLGIGGTP